MTKTMSRPEQLNGFVSGRVAPVLIRARDGELELWFLLGVKQWADEGRTYSGTDYHRVVLRAPRTNLAASYTHALPPGTRLHVHGRWREDGAAGPALVVSRLFQPAGIPEGTPIGRPMSSQHLESTP